MKKSITFLAILMIAATTAIAQWKTVLATHDESPNGTGHQTISVGVVNDKVFVALVNRPSNIQIAAPFDEVNILKDSSLACYLVGYANATTETGRLGTYPYGSGATLGLYAKWFAGFDEVYLYRAFKIIVTPDSLVYVANNDPDHNILVFKVTRDSVISTDYRMKTGAVDIQGLAVDNNGNIYVSAIKGSDANTAEVKVFKGIKAAGNTWETTHDDNPLTTINLPVGVYRGLTVSGDGTQLFVSSMSGRNVTKYSGSPATGYTKAAGFSFQMTDADSIPGTRFDTTTGTFWNLGRPLGMAYLNGNNLLFVASARWWGFAIKARNLNNAYTYSKIFLVNPFTGAGVDTINIAKYYFDSSGSYTTQIFGPDKYISGYTSSYDVALDNQKNLYSQSMYSWTVEKWTYTGTLPVISGNSVRRTNDMTPEHFTLEQNYPNPFNPATKINFSIAAMGNVTLKVYDLLGKEIATLVDGEMTAGSYSAPFDASRLSTGVYFYTLRTGNFVETKKMMLAK